MEEKYKNSTRKVYIQIIIYVCQNIENNLFFRPSPKRDTKSTSKTKTTGTTSFQDFQASVSDAWDLDDDEFCVISGLESIS